MKKFKKVLALVLAVLMLVSTVQCLSGLVVFGATTPTKPTTSTYSYPLSDADDLTALKSDNKLYFQNKNTWEIATSEEALARAGATYWGVTGYAMDKTNVYGAVNTVVFNHPLSEVNSYYDYSKNIVVYEPEEVDFYYTRSLQSDAQYSAKNWHTRPVIYAMAKTVVTEKTDEESGYNYTEYKTPLRVAEFGLSENSGKVKLFNRFYTKNVVETVWEDAALNNGKTNSINYDTARAGGTVNTGANTEFTTDNVISGTIPAADLTLDDFVRMLKVNLTYNNGVATQPVFKISAKYLTGDNNETVNDFTIKLTKTESLPEGTKRAFGYHVYNDNNIATDSHCEGVFGDATVKYDIALYDEILAQMKAEENKVKIDKFNDEWTAAAKKVVEDNKIDDPVSAKDEDVAAAIKAVEDKEKEYNEAFADLVTETEMPASELEKYIDTIAIGNIFDRGLNDLRFPASTLEFKVSETHTENDFNSEIKDALTVYYNNTEKNKFQYITNTETLNDIAAPDTDNDGVRDPVYRISGGTHVKHHAASGDNTYGSDGVVLEYTYLGKEKIYPAYSMDATVLMCDPYQKGVAITLGASAWDVKEDGSKSRSIYGVNYGIQYNSTNGGIILKAYYPFLNQKVDTEGNVKTYCYYVGGSDSTDTWYSNPTGDQKSMSLLGLDEDTLAKLNQVTGLSNKDLWATYHQKYNNYKGDDQELTVDMNVDGIEFTLDVGFCPGRFGYNKSRAKEMYLGLFGLGDTNYGGYIGDVTVAYDVSDYYASTANTLWISTFDKLKEDIGTYSKDDMTAIKNWLDAYDAYASSDPIEIEVKNTVEKKIGPKIKALRKAYNMLAKDYTFFDDFEGDLNWEVEYKITNPDLENWRDAVAGDVSYKACTATTTFNASTTYFAKNEDTFYKVENPVAEDIATYYTSQGNYSKIFYKDKIASVKETTLAEAKAVEGAKVIAPNTAEIENYLTYVGNYTDYFDYQTETNTYSQAAATKEGDSKGNAFWGIHQDVDDATNNTLWLRKSFNARNMNPCDGDTAGRSNQSKPSVLYTPKDSVLDPELYVSSYSGKLYLGKTHSPWDRYKYSIGVVYKYNSETSWRTIGFNGLGAVNNVLRSSELGGMQEGLGDNTVETSVAEAKGKSFYLGQWVDFDLTYSFDKGCYVFTVTGYENIGTGASDRNEANGIVKGDIITRSFDISGATKLIKKVGLISTDVSSMSFDDIAVQLVDAPFVEKVIERDIPEIENLTVHDENLVFSVENVYNLLTEEEKAKVLNAETLFAARRKLDELLEARDNALDLTNFQIIDFEDKPNRDDIMGTQHFELYNASTPTAMQRVDNPYKMGLNTSDKVMSIARNSVISGDFAIYAIKPTAIDDYYGNPAALGTISLKTYVTTSDRYGNPPIIIYDYKDEDNWEGFYPYITNGYLDFKRAYKSNGSLNHNHYATTGFNPSRFFGDTDYSYLKFTAGWINVTLEYDITKVTVTVEYENADGQRDISADFSYTLLDTNETRFAFATFQSKAAYFDDIRVNLKDNDEVNQVRSFLKRNDYILNLRPAALFMSETDKPFIDSLVADYEAVTTTFPNAKYFMPYMEEKIEGIKAALKFARNRDNAEYLKERDQKYKDEAERQNAYLAANNAYDGNVYFKEDFRNGYSIFYNTPYDGGANTGKLSTVEDGKFARKTADTEIKEGKSYYTMAADAFTKRTTDTELDPNKVYYIDDPDGGYKVVYSPKVADIATYYDSPYKRVENPVKEDLGTYYEDVEVLRVTGMTQISIKPNLLPKKPHLANISYRVQSKSVPEWWNSLRIYTSYVSPTAYASTIFTGYDAENKLSTLGSGTHTGVVTNERVSLNCTDVLDVNIQYMPSGSYILTISDQSGNTLMRNGSANLQAILALNAFGKDTHYSNFEVYYDYGLYDEDITVSDIKPYYTANTYLNPGDITMVYGDTIADTVSTVQIAEVTTLDSNTVGFIDKTAFDFEGVQEDEFSIDPVAPTEGGWQSVKVVQRTEDSIKFIIPSTLSDGIYAVKLNGANYITDPTDYKVIYLNAPSIDYTTGMDGRTSAPGTEVQVVGKNITPNRIYTNDNDYSTYTNNVKVKLKKVEFKATSDTNIVEGKVYYAKVDGEYEKVAEPTVDDIAKYFERVKDGEFIDAKITEVKSDYSLKFEVPHNIEVPEDGSSVKYELYIYNGYGDDTCWSIPYITEFAKDLRSTWNQTTVNILDFIESDMEVGETAGIDHERRQNNVTYAFVNALEYLDKKGGGILYIPEGNYRLVHSIVIPPNVQIKGDGLNKTSLVWSPYNWEQYKLLNSIIRYEKNVSITDISINASRVGGIFAGLGRSSDNFYLERVRLYTQPEAGGPSNAANRMEPLGTGTEMYTVLANEVKAPLFATELKGNNINIIDFDAASTHNQPQRPLVNDFSGSMYMRLIGCRFEEGWSEVICNRAIVEDCEFGPNACVGIWGHGTYFQNCNFHDQTSNNRELYVGDRSANYSGKITPYSTDSDNKLFAFSGGSRLSANTMEFAQLYIKNGQGEGQTRTVVDYDPETGWFEVDRPFTIAPNRNTAVVLRRPRENIYFVENYWTNGGAGGFYGGFADLIYDGNIRQRNGGFYQQSIFNDVNWFMSIINERWIYDPNSFGAVGGSSAGTGMVWNALNGKNASMCFTLRNCDLDGAALEFHCANTITDYMYHDILLDNNRFKNLATRAALNCSNSQTRGEKHLDGWVEYRNTYENVGEKYNTSDQASHVIATAKKSTNPVGSKRWMYLEKEEQDYYSQLPLGDVDADGSVTAKDATMLRNYLIGRVELAEDQLLRADVDGVDGVTLMDAQQIKYYVAGVISTFPAEQK